MNFKKKVNGSWTDIPHYIHKTSTDIITTLPANIYPNDTTATVGLKGNMSQSGAPTPDNPVTPNGCGERTGNLYNISAHDTTNGYINNAQLIEDGTTATWKSAEISEYISISGDTAYTFNGIGSYNSLCYALYDGNKQLISTHRYNGASIIHFTSPDNARYFRFTHIKTFTKAMMVEGTYTSSTMPKFEPYGYKIPISSANTTTPIYLGEVESTRRIKKLVLTGEEAWLLWNGNYYSSVIDRKGAIGTIFCTHFINSSQQGISYSNQSTSGLKIASIAVPFVSDLSGLKELLAAQYAAGTPVTVWYVLATPETAVVNELLMKIGDYADEVSNVSIPVTAGGDTISVDTTLQPSEVTVNYKGWHPVQNVHERDNGAWT